MDTIFSQHHKVFERALDDIDLLIQFNQEFLPMKPEAFEKTLFTKLTELDTSSQSSSANKVLTEIERLFKLRYHFLNPLDHTGKETVQEVIYEKLNWLAVSQEHNFDCKPVDAIRRLHAIKKKPTNYLRDFPVSLIDEALERIEAHIYTRMSTPLRGDDQADVLLDDLWKMSADTGRYTFQATHT